MKGTFLGFKKDGVLYPPNEIPQEIQDKIAIAIIEVLLNKVRKAG